MKTRVLGSPMILSLWVITLVAVMPHSSSSQHASKPDASMSTLKKTVYKPTGNEGTITGTIDFTGKVAPRQEIDMCADPVCAQLNFKPLNEDLLISNGRLANAFVYVKKSSVVDFYEFEKPSAPVILEHKNCRYVPRVLGVQVGQSFRVLNSDATAHNTNATHGTDAGTPTNRAHNVSQPPNGPAIEWEYQHPETFIKFRDNQHPWEQAYLGIFSHPFFAVSDENGIFRIEGLPPGNYSIVAWHEKLGERTAEITIAPLESRTLNFTFE